MNRAKELPSQEELLEMFYYDGGLKWKVDKRIGPLNAKAGENVNGSIDSGGYAQIMIDRVKYRLSRIVYQTVYGNLTPELIVDHINRNRIDNRIENLRAIPFKLNQRNCKKQSNNTTGINGVYLEIRKRLKVDGTEYDYADYVCHWPEITGKKKQKRFSISKHGEAEAFRLACEHRKAMIQSLIDQGEWYDPSHGT